MDSMTLDEPTWTPSTRPQIPVPVLAAATCVGYYLASLVGLQLRFPPATTSILWPPNAVLTAALVLAPPRRWLAILLFVLPVHILIQMGTGWPLSLILALFVTNCSEALIAAGGMALLTNTPWRFDTLRGLTAFFLAAVAIGPVLSSFADAGVVSLVRGEEYWRVWGNRTASNILAELTVVPAVVGGTLAGLRWWRRGRLRPRLEVVVLAQPRGNRVAESQQLVGPDPVASRDVEPDAAGLAAAISPLGRDAVRADREPDSRFFFTTLVSAWAVVHGIGPFASVAPATTVTAVTLALIVVAMTLMALATLAEERRQTQRALAIRLEFEGLLSRLSSALVQQPSDEMIGAFDRWLSRIGRVLGLDCLRVSPGPARTLSCRSTHG